MSAANRIAQFRKSYSTAQFAVAPSILSADFSKLGEEIKAVESAGADWIHVDVMDGLFVPNLTLGAPVIKKLRKTTDKVFDVHLMIEKPENLLQDFIDAGSDIITIHVEATTKAKEIFEKIRAAGCAPGITMRPGTSVDQVLPFLHLVDLVLVMTVEPGFGGQSFMKEQVAKVKTLRQAIDKLGRQVLIEVDGGINPETAGQCKEADVLVAGNYVFGNNYADAIAKLKKAKS